MGERLGGFVYGTIVVLAVVVAGGKAYPEQPGIVATMVVITTGVFWLAHVYSHALAHSVSRDQQLSLAELRQIARREAAIIEAGVPSLVALLLGSLGVFSGETAIWYIACTCGPTCSSCQLPMRIWPAKRSSTHCRSRAAFDLLAAS